jgi:hypothetical protein
MIARPWQPQAAALDHHWIARSWQPQAAALYDIGKGVAVSYEASRKP